MGNSACCRDPETSTKPEAEQKNTQNNHQIIGVMSDSFKFDSNRQNVNRSQSVLSNDAEIAQSISLRTGRPTFYDLIQQQSDKSGGNQREELGLETQFAQTLIQDSEAAPTFQPKDRIRVTNATMTFGKSALSQNLNDTDDLSNYTSNHSRREASPPPTVKTVATEVEMENKGAKEEYKESAQLSTDFEQTDDGVIRVAAP